MLHEPGLLRMLEDGARRRVNIGNLQVRVWLTRVGQSLEVGLNQLALICESKRLGSRSKFFKWRAGERPNPTSVLRIDKLAPGSRLLFELPLWHLLRPEAIPYSLVERTLKAFRSQDGQSVWSFPNDIELSTRGVDLTTCGRNDVEALSARGDEYGLTILVALVREAEINEEPQLHIYRSMALVRTLPSLLATSPWNAFRRELCSVVRHLIERSSLTSVHLHVNWDRVAELSMDPAIKHPIDWRKSPQDIIDPTNYRAPRLPPPSDWAAWLYTASGNDLRSRRQADADADADA